MGISPVYNELIKFAGIDHIAARKILIEAFRQVMGRDPTIGEIQGAQAVGYLETGYGMWWKGDGAGSNNWGSIQCCMPDKATGICPPNTFKNKDSRPTADGKNIEYSACYKKYKSPLEGAMDLIQNLYKNNRKGRGEGLLNAARSGSVTDFSKALYESGYYEGFGKDKDERIANHVKAMNRSMNSFSKALNEDLTLLPGTGQEMPAGDINADQLNADYIGLMRQLVAHVRKDKLRKIAGMPTYTESLRRLRKLGDEDKLKQFQRIFKDVFDEAWVGGDDEPEKVALIQALKEIGYDSIYSDKEMESEI